MIELILTVCALSAPSQCDEQRLQFVSQESLMQCMMQAPPYIAQWSNEHPADARHAVAMRLSRRTDEDLIGDCDRRPTARSVEPIAVRRRRRLGPCD